MATAPLPANVLGYKLERVVWPCTETRLCHGAKVWRVPRGKAMYAVFYLHSLLLQLGLDQGKIDARLNFLSYVPLICCTFRFIWCCDCAVSSAIFLPHEVYDLGQKLVSCLNSLIITVPLNHRKDGVVCERPKRRIENSVSKRWVLLVSRVGKFSDGSLDDVPLPTRCQENSPSATTSARTIRSVSAHCHVCPGLKALPRFESHSLG